MSAPDPAVSAVRTAVRRFLDTHRPAGPLAVACSGGADSLALAAATVHCARDVDGVQGLVVDHGLQPGSREVAEQAVQALRGLGVDRATVLPVTVDGPGGPEAAARRARYDALRTAVPGAVVLLGHTRDDQAETVLLGLGRGSGPRSIAGMRELDPPWGRPLLTVTRAQTRAACAALGLQPWSDPHNADPRYQRVRLRTEVLPLLDDVLAGGVAGALARTAAQLQDDLDALDRLAAEACARSTEGTDLLVGELGGHPAAVRRRVLRSWLLAAGVPELTDPQLRAVDDLVGNWRGQGEVALRLGFRVRREHERLCVCSGLGLES